jgi:glycosyltransferase involved in cell wall biosynthesis
MKSAHDVMKPNGKVSLGINGWRIHGQRTGIGRYLFNVVIHWTADAVRERFKEVNFYTPKAVDRRDIPLPQNIRERVVGPDCRMLVWENLRLAPVAGDDVLLCPSYSRPLFARGKTVVAMFDAILHLFPQYHPLFARVSKDRLYGWSVRHASLVITGSVTAREDIVRSYGVPRDRIRIVHLAPAEVFTHLPNHSDIEKIRQRYLETAAPYFLFVGKLTARRNIPKLMKAFAELKRRTQSLHKLLVIGLNTTNLKLPELAAELGITADFKHFDYVPDEDLNLLYNGAEAFVMPYSYEAVSLTALEAQATGTPVIAVDTPGLRETTNGEAFFVPRAEVREIVEGLSQVATNPVLRRDLSARGLVHAQRFTWERCAAETLNVLEEAARSSDIAGRLPARS